MPTADILDFLSSRPGARIALVGHPRPDGDSLGSTLGLARTLRAVGALADVVNATPLPDRYRFLDPDGALIRNYDTPVWHQQYDCLGVLDCGDLDRLDEINRPAALTLPTFTIDHHASSRGLGEAVWIDPVASSTSEMVADLVLAAGWPLSPEAAAALWTGIVTDTGRFSFENATPGALAAAGRCVAAGAKPAEVADQVYLSHTLAERRLQALVIDRIEMRRDGRFVLSWLTHADLEQAGMGIEGAQDLVNIIRHIVGVEVAVFLYELATGPGQPPAVKASLRTREPHNAIAVARRFGGGGHARAAGCTIPLPLGEAKAVLAEYISAMYL